MEGESPAKEPVAELLANPAEERRRAYKALGLRVTAHVNGSIKVCGNFEGDFFLSNKDTHDLVASIVYAPEQQARREARRARRGELEAAPWSYVYGKDTTNVLGLLYVTAAVQVMKERGWGHLVNISSVAGSKSGTLWGAYSGTNSPSTPSPRPYGWSSSRTTFG